MILKSMVKDYLHLQKVVILKEHFIKITQLMDSYYIRMDKNILEV
jgi:hypothetical protein